MLVVAVPAAPPRVPVPGFPSAHSAGHSAPGHARLQEMSAQKSSLRMQPCMVSNVCGVV